MLLRCWGSSQGQNMELQFLMCETDPEVKDHKGHGKCDVRGRLELWGTQKME